MNSFTQRSLADISNLNYTATDVDQTENVNRQQDEAIEDANAHFDRLITINNDHVKRRNEQWGELIEFSQQAKDFYNWNKERIQTNEILNNFINVSELEDDDTSLQLNMSQAEVSTAGRQLEDSNPELAHLLYMRNKGLLNDIQLLTTTSKLYEAYFERARGEQIIVGEDGKAYTFTSAANSAEAIVASQEIARNFIQPLINAGFGPNLLRKHLISPVFKEHQGYIAKFISDKTVANKEEATALRKNHLKSLVKTNKGDGVIQWIRIYHGLNDNNWLKSRDEAFKFIEELAETDEFSVQDLEDILDHEFIANDGSTQIIRDYWKVHSSKIIALKRKIQLKQIESKQEEKDLAKNTFKTKTISEWTDSETGVTDDMLFEAQKQHMIQFGERAEWIDNYLTQNDYDDLELDRILEHRYSNGEIITSDDLRGLQDSELIQKWRARSTSGNGMTQSQLTNKKEWIIGQASAYTNEQDASKGKSDKWIAVKQQANDFFNAIYVAERGAGSSHEAAYNHAMVQTKAEIYKGTFDSFPTIPRDVASQRALQTTLTNLAENSKLLYSKDPWLGEELHLKAALDYITHGGQLPDYYRRFPLKITPYELMKTRLIATGLIKDDGKLIPERTNLTVEDQELLTNKPSPSSTYRVVENNTDIDWMIRALNDPRITTKEDLIPILRAKANSWNQYSSADPSWLRLVEISKEDLEEFYAITGDLPPYLRLENLTPGVAMKILEDTLIDN